MLEEEAMAHPIQSTVLSDEDFEKLVKKLKNPRPDPAARKMYERGKQIHRQVHRE